MLTSSSLSRFLFVVLCYFKVASCVCCFSSDSDSAQTCQKLKQRHRNSDVTDRVCGRVETHLTHNSSVPEQGRDFMMGGQRGARAQSGGHVRKMVEHISNLLLGTDEECCSISVRNFMFTDKKYQSTSASLKSALRSDDEQNCNNCSNIWYKY